MPQARILAFCPKPTFWEMGGFPNLHLLTYKGLTYMVGFGPKPRLALGHRELEVLAPEDELRPEELGHGPQGLAPAASGDSGRASPAPRRAGERR